MHAQHHGFIIASCLLLGACAHQGGSTSGNSQRSLDDPQRLSESQDQNCQAISPGTGETTDGPPLAVTDCDLMAVRRAADAQQRSLESQWPDDMDAQGGGLPGGIPRLPTSSGPDLLGGQ